LSAALPDNFRDHPTIAKLSADQRRALRLLDEAEPRGSTESIMLAHGFAIELLAGLVRDGLATAESERMRAPAGGVTEVTPEERERHSNPKSLISAPIESTAQLGLL
jgi:hypothetical protein